MGNRNNPRYNSEGYPDPTAFEAIVKIEREELRFRKLLRMILTLCELAEFRLEGRIVLVDKKSGKIWR